MIICCRCGCICRNEQRFCAKCGNKLEKKDKEERVEEMNYTGEILYEKNWIAYDNKLIQKTGKIVITNIEIIFIENLFKNNPHLIIPMENIIYADKKRITEMSTSLLIKDKYEKEYIFNVGKLSSSETDYIINIINHHSKSELKSQVSEKYS